MTEPKPPVKVELLPCPFCGEQPEIKTVEFEDAGGEKHTDCVSIHCNNEGCFENWAIQPKDEMVQGWNTRSGISIPADDFGRILELLGNIAKRPDLPNPDRDADWKNCQKWSSADAKEALSLARKYGSAE